MSDLEAAILTTRPDWGSLPAELSLAFDWMQQHGRAEKRADLVFATPYAGERQLGAVFQDGLTTEGWLDDEEAAARLLPIAESDGAGGFIALWRPADGAPAKAVVINDLDQTLIADSALDLLRLVAIGHDELRTFTISEPAPAESAAAHAEFRAWVEETFDVDVPEAWGLPASEAFDRWWRVGTGEEEAAPARSITENPDPEAGRTTVSGPITVLLGLLGCVDGPEPAAALGELTSVDAGATIKSSARRFKKAGVEVTLKRGVITTIFVHIALEAEGLFGMPPIEYPWWNGPDLIDGVTKESTKDDVIALLGEPERSGLRHVRYRVGDRFLNLTFSRRSR